MSNGRYIPWKFGYTLTLPPSQLRRRVGDFLLFCAFGGAMLSILFGWIAFNAPFWKLPIEGYAAFLKLSAKLLLNSASGGAMFSEQAPAIIAALEESGMDTGFFARLYGSAVAGFICALWLALPMLTPLDGFIHLRGARRFYAPDALKRLKRLLPRGDAPFLHPAIPGVPAYVWGNGAYVVGSPGSGKTTILMPLIKTVADRNEHALILDVKGDYTEKLGKAHILAPWDRRSVVWDVSKDITTELQADALAAMLIRAIPNDKNAIWGKAAQAVFASLLKKLVAERPQRWGFSDLAELLSLPTEKWVEIVAQYDPVAAKVLQGAAEVSSSVAFNVSTELRQLPRVASLFAALERVGIQRKAPRFSAREWANGGGKVRQLILRYDEQNSGVVGFLVPFLIDYLATLLDSLPEQQKNIHWLFLDEFAQLPKVERMRRFLEVGRSKGFRTVIATQDPVQVESIYGKNDADSLQSNATISIVARLSASHAQEQIARYMGTRAVAYYGVSTTSNGSSNGGTSGQWQEKNEPLVLASELDSALGVLTKNGKPSGVRALLRISGDPQDPIKSGGIFELEWPLADIQSQRKASAPMPHTKSGAAAALWHLSQADKTLAARVLAIREDSDCADLGPADLVRLLKIEGHINSEYIQQRENNVRRVLADLTREETPSAKEPAEGDSIGEALKMAEAVGIATGNAALAHGAEVLENVHLFGELLDALAGSPAPAQIAQEAQPEEEGEDEELRVRRAALKNRYRR